MIASKNETAELKSLSLVSKAFLDISNGITRQLSINLFGREQYFDFEESSAFVSHINAYFVYTCKVSAQWIFKEGSELCQDETGKGHTLFKDDLGFWSTPTTEYLKVSRCMTIEVIFNVHKMNNNNTSYLYMNPVLSHHGYGAGWEIRMSRYETALMVSNSNGHVEPKIVDAIQLNKVTNLVIQLDNTSVTFSIDGKLKKSVKMEKYSKLTTYPLQGHESGGFKLAGNPYWRDRCLRSSKFYKVRISHCQLPRQLLFPQNFQE